MNDVDQKSQFHREMLRLYREAASFGYYPTRFLEMVNAEGGVNAAKKLLRESTVSDGFRRLWEEDRLDLSVEAVVLNPSWEALFTSEELAVARGRLVDARYLSAQE